METELSKAVEVLCKALAEDKSEGSYYFGWQANIAMQFKDEFDREWNRLNKDREGIPERPIIGHVGNNAAKNFLDLLIATTLDKESLNHE